ncbi:MAG: LptF/LptG family permease [Pseudomonadota bacterium]
MTSLDRYILRQFFGPFVLIIVVLTLVIWLTQSLQRIDILIENGSGFGLFLYLSLLIIPSLLVILIPFALFGAGVYALYRMHSDSEIAVIYAAGISRTRLAMPILLVTLFGALATLYVALDLSPRTYRILKQNVLTLRTDLAGNILRGGQFVTAINGFTIYVDETSGGNEFRGILINDYRNPNETRTYMAERGALRETGAGPVLILVNGNVQRVRKDKPIEELDLLPFGETRINVSSLQSDQELQLELTERYLSELLNPDLSREWERNNLGKLRAEAHNRLATPLYAFSYVLIALFALVGGAYNRRGYLVRVALAGAGVITLRVGGFIAQTMAAETGTQWLQYALPLSVIIVGGAVLADGPRMRLRASGEAKSGQPSQTQAGQTQAGATQARETPA